MQDEHTHRRVKPLFGWSLVLILAGGGAVLGALVAGYAGLRLAEAIVPLPSESSVVKQSLMPVLRLAICFSLAGTVIGFLLTFLTAKRLLEERTARTATRFAMAVLPSVVVVFIMAGMGVRWYLISRDLDAELAKIRAAGEPTCTADLSWYRPASPAELENGEAFLKAFSLLNQNVDSQCPIRLHNPPSDENMWPDIERAEPLLQRNEQCLNLLHAAAARTGGTRYPLVSNGSSPVPIPNPDDRAYTAARLLALEACIRESHGDQATEFLLRPLRLKDCSNDPVDASVPCRTAESRRTEPRLPASSYRSSSTAAATSACPRQSTTWSRST